MLAFHAFVFAIYALSLALYLCSLALIARLLGRMLFRHRALPSLHNMSGLLKLNMLCWTAMLGTGIPHILFMAYRVYVAIWSNGESRTPTAAVFWSQVFTQCFIPMITFSVLFLTLDRLACIVVPFHYTAQRKQSLLQFATVVLIGLYLAIFYAFLQELPLPETTDCLAFACTIVKTGSKAFIVSKIVGGILIILSGLAFLIKVQWQRKVVMASTVAGGGVSISIANASGGGRRSAAGAQPNSAVANHAYYAVANKVTLLMIGTELLLNFVPQLIVLTLQETVGIVPSQHIGPHNMFLSALDAQVAALTFRWLFKHKLAVAQQQHCGPPPVRYVTAVASAQQYRFHNHPHPK